jgi:hypothetical protein
MRAFHLIYPIAFALVALLVVRDASAIRIRRSPKISHKQWRKAERTLAEPSASDLTRKLGEKVDGQTRETIEHGGGAIINGKSVQMIVQGGAIGATAFTLTEPRAFTVPGTRLQVGMWHEPEHRVWFAQPGVLRNAGVTIKTMARYQSIDDAPPAWSGELHLELSLLDGYVFEPLGAAHLGGAVTKAELIEMVGSLRNPPALTVGDHKIWAGDTWRVIELNPKTYTVGLTLAPRRTLWLPDRVIESAFEDAD